MSIEELLHETTTKPVQEDGEIFQEATTMREMISTYGTNEYNEFQVKLLFEWAGQYDRTKNRRFRMMLFRDHMATFAITFCSLVASIFSNGAPEPSRSFYVSFLIAEFFFLVFWNEWETVFGHSNEEFALECLIPDFGSEARNQKKMVIEHAEYMGLHHAEDYSLRNLIHTLKIMDADYRKMTQEMAKEDEKRD